MRYKFLAPALTLYVLTATAAIANEGNCKVAKIRIEPGATVKWTGPCPNGLAEGTGVLDIVKGKTELIHYEGGMKDGLLHGPGYLRHKGTEEHEGGFENGLFHGFGVNLSMGGKYEGEWKHGQRDGKGKMVFTLGGQYDGQWKNNQFHGPGTLRFVGGRELAAEFDNGRWPGQAAVVRPQTEHAITSERTGTHVRKRVAHGPIPFSKSYDELSEQDRAFVRQQYRLLDDNDEPPYPENGTAALYKAISTVTGTLRAEGTLHMFVDVDANGSATSASVYQTPSTEFARAAMSLALLQKYKPGVCAGRPCAMKFPISVKVSTNY